MRRCPKWPQLPNKVRKLERITRDIGEYQTYIEGLIEECDVPDTCAHACLQHATDELEGLIAKLRKRKTGDPTYVK